MDEICPICGTRLKEGKGAFQYSHEGKAYNFCTIECMRVFQQFPEVYVGQEEAEIQTLEDSGF